MTIQKLNDFAENGDKNLTGIDVRQGFVQADKPARQWFNSLFNSIVKKVNEVITALESLVISTNKIADGAVTSSKLGSNLTLSGTPKIPTAYSGTTTIAPNTTIDTDGTFKRSTYSFGTAATRNIGAAVGNLVERGADGYPVNNNAIGVGQTWQNVTASRASNVTYTNTTGRPITVLVSGTPQKNASIESYINDIKISTSSNGSVEIVGQTHTFIVPSGSTYRINIAYLSLWSELR